MKKFGLILLLCFFLTKLSCQVVFCSPGAEWRANFIVGRWTPDAVTNDYIRYTGDTVIGTETFKVLKHTKFYQQCNDGFTLALMLIKQKGDTIFMRSGFTQGNWEVLYNFSSAPGSGWTTNYFSSNGPSVTRTYTFTVDSIKYLTENSFNLKQMHVTCKYLVYGSTIDTRKEIITERYGWGFLFRFYNQQGCDTDRFSETLCYTDNAFGTKHFSSTACDYANPVGMEDLGINEKSFLVYPNPCHNILNVDLEKAHERSELRLIDILGKELMSTKQNQLNISELPKGIYFLNLYQNGYLIKTQKVVKE